MGNVMIIPAKRQVGNTSRRQEDKPKLRVAAYCRVSTDSDEQASIPSISRKILNGSLPAFMQMTVFQVPTLKREKNLIV